MSDASLLDTLNDRFSDVKRSFYGLKQQQQYMVLTLLGVIGLLLVYLVLLRPALQSVDRAEKKYQAKQELLQWMKANESAAMAASGRGASGGPSLSGQNILAVVNSAATRNGITLKRYEPEGENNLRVWLEKVSFNRMMSWLNQLKNNNGVSVSSISVDADKASGFVSAKVLLKG